MSKIKITESVTNKIGGRKVPALEFVRRYKSLAAAVSKATAGTEKVTRDAVGNRKMGSPDFASLVSVHRSISRRNKDAKMTLQMLPDLKLSAELIISLIMSPKDMYNDEINILSDSSELLSATLMTGMTKIVTDYMRKNHDLSDFVQMMLMEVVAIQGGLPVAIIPENALDDLINNYNGNLSLENHKTVYDVNSFTPQPLNLLGVPDYLSASNNKDRLPPSGRMKFGASVTFDLQSYDSYRPVKDKPTAMNAFIQYSKLSDKPDEPWMFTTDDGLIVNIDELVSVTDNIDVLKMPVIQQASLESRIGETLKAKGYNKLESSLESMKLDFERKQRQAVLSGQDRQMTDVEVEKLIFRNRRLAHTPVAAIRNTSELKRNSIGEPIRRIFDSACFIPISEQGNPQNKLGGYVMVDENGNPLTSDMLENEQLMDLTNNSGGKGNFVSSMNDRSSQLLNGKECGDMSTYMLRSFMTRTTEEMTERDIVSRVKNGQYANGIQIASNDDFFWLMATRIMKGQRTQLLWIPKEYLVYFAMDYDEFGFGKSLLDDIRNITSMRIMLMVSGIAASLRNSIGRTKVTVKLDEEDPDAEKTIEDIQDEILKSRMNPIPFGVNNVADISKYLQRSCYEFEISGSNAIPDMQVSFEQTQSNYPLPDNDLKEELKDLSIKHFGLTRDMIDAADGVEFAIQAATSNMLTQKRTMRMQRKVTPMITEYVRKIATHSESIVNDLRDFLRNNYGSLQVSKMMSFFGLKDKKVLANRQFKKLVVEQCINTFVNNLRIELPSPASTTLDTQKIAFEAQAEFYKEALDYIFNESFFDTALNGEGLSDHVDMIKNIYLSHYMRDWMSKNNILPELGEITTIGEDGKIGLNIQDALEKHIKALGMSTGNFFTRFKDYAIKMGTLMEPIGDGSTSGETETGGGGGGSDDSAGSYDDSDDTDDFSFDDEEDSEADPETTDDKPDGGESSGNEDA